MRIGYNIDILIKSDLKENKKWMNTQWILNTINTYHGHKKLITRQQLKKECQDTKDC